MKIDAHNHFWIYDPDRDSWIDDSMQVIKRDFLPKDFEPIIKEFGFDGTIAVQADQSEAETHFLLELASKNPFIKGVVGWIDIQAEDIEDRFLKFEKFNLLKGFRHIAQAERDDFLISDKFVRGIKALSKTKFSYDLLVFPSQLAAAIELVQKVPEQSFILDHIAKPPIKKGEIKEWAKWIHLLAQNRNVSCKLSGMVTEADWQNWKEADFYPYLDVVTEAFGIDRLMFASDFPVCLLAADYEGLLRIIENYYSEYTDFDRDKIFGLNAIKYYNVKE